MNSYVFSGIVLAGLALFLYFYFYQNFSHRVNVQPSAIHQPENRAFHAAGEDDH